MLYALLRVLSSPTSRLVTIDPASGVATLIGDTGLKFADLAFGGGTLYAVSGDGASPAETLYTLNTSDGTPTLVTALGNGDDGETIAFNPMDGLLYHASGILVHIFETVDPNTLAVTDVPLSGSVFDEFTGLGFDPGSGQFLAGDLSTLLYRVSSSGVVTVIGSTDHDVGDITVVLPPVGASSTSSLVLTTISLAAAACFVMFVMLGRRARR